MIGRLDLASHGGANDDDGAAGGGCACETSRPARLEWAGMALGLLLAVRLRRRR